METKNPMFSGIKNDDQVLTRDNCATYRGITIKTIFYVLLAIVAGAVTAVMLWNQTKNESVSSTLLVTLFLSTIVGFIAVMVGRSNPRSAKIAGAIYAICEGMFLGVISLIGEVFYSGIVAIAGISTVVVFGVMLALFASGIIRNKSKFVSFGISLGSSVIIMCLVTMLLGFMFSSLVDNLAVVILVEALFMVYACVSLLMNFIEANQLVQGGFSKEYEWSCALGLLVTILYIYIQILRILMIVYDLFGRNN